MDMIPTLFTFLAIFLSQFGHTKAEGCKLSGIGVMLELQKVYLSEPGDHYKLDLSHFTTAIEQIIGQNSKLTSTFKGIQSNALAPVLAGETTPEIGQALPDIGDLKFADMFHGRQLVVVTNTHDKVKEDCFKLKGELLSFRTDSDIFHLRAIMNITILLKNKQI